MKNIYSILTLFLLFFTVSLSGQSRIYAPDLRAPEDAETGSNVNVVLDWDAVTGQTTEITYEAQLATTEDFTDAFVFPRTDLTAAQTEELKFGQHYFWRVMAFDGDEASEWSEVWSFTVTNTVNIKSPKIGAEVYANPEITWDELTGLSKYQLNLDTSYVWNESYSGAEADVRATFVLSETNMWLVGDDGLIQQYDGATWTTMDAGVTNDLTSIFFIDESNGYAVGTDGVVLNYDGTAWTVVDAGATDDLNGVAFSDANNGWVVGVGGYLLTFKDGVWTEATSGTDEDLTGVSVVSATDVWACGEGEVVLHFTGTDWMLTEVGTRDLFAIWFNDASNGWVTGKSGKMHHYNGTEWTEQESGTSKDLYSISMVGDVGFAVGKGGTMVSYDGEWQVVTSGVTVDLYGIWLSGDLGLSGGEEGIAIMKSGLGFDSPYNQVYNVSKDSVNFHLEYLPFGSKVYYRMRAIHSSDTSDWSSPRSMSTQATPILDKPKDETNELHLTNLFKWKEYEGVVDYFYEIDDNEAFDSPINAVVDSLSIEQTMQEFGKTYYWRVKTEHPFDISGWSEVWSFTTTNTLTLLNPEDAETDIASCPLYSWEEIEGASGYQILIDVDPDFSEPVDAFVTDASYQCQVPMQKKTMYYWKVRAASKQDTSSWSETWSFTTEGYAGLEEEFGAQSVSIYPNPSNGVFSMDIFSLKHEEVFLSVTDLTGKIIFNETMLCNSGENTKEVKLDNLQKGLYLVSIQKGNEVVTKKLFIH